MDAYITHIWTNDVCQDMLYCYCDLGYYNFFTGEARPTQDWSDTYIHITRHTGNDQLRLIHGSSLDRFTWSGYKAILKSLFSSLSVSTLRLVLEKLIST